MSTVALAASLLVAEADQSSNAERFIPTSVAAIAAESIYFTTSNRELYTARWGKLIAGYRVLANGGWTAIARNNDRAYVLVDQNRAYEFVGGTKRRIVFESSKGSTISRISDDATVIVTFSARDSNSQLWTSTTSGFRRRLTVAGKITRISSDVSGYGRVIVVRQVQVGNRKSVGRNWIGQLTKSALREIPCDITSKEFIDDAVYVGANRVAVVKAGLDGSCKVVVARTTDGHIESTQFQKKKDRVRLFSIVRGAVVRVCFLGSSEIAVGDYKSGKFERIARSKTAGLLFDTDQNSESQGEFRKAYQFLLELRIGVFRNWNEGIIVGPEGIYSIRLLDRNRSIQLKRWG